MEQALSHDPIKSDDVPATQWHLELVRQELKSDIISVQLEMRAGFQSMESILLGMKAMMEEQNSRNRYVLDGYSFLFDKVERSEKRLELIEKKVFGIEQN